MYFIRISNNSINFPAGLTVKRIASILLLSLLAFNWIGYRFLSGFLEHKADFALETRIDKADYDPARLIEIRVPLNAPYLSGNSSDFERYDGMIELDGVHYRYVKRKVVNGELVLLCLPNENKNRFQNSRVDFFKLVNDLNRPTQGKEKNSGSSIKSFAAEYKPENNSWTIASLNPVYRKNAIAQNSCRTADYNSVPKQPPRS